MTKTNTYAKKNDVPLLDFHDDVAFKNSKLGIASSLMADLEKSFSDDLSVSFVPEDFVPWQPKDDFTIDKATLSNAFTKGGIRIVDLVCDDTSYAYIYGGDKKPLSLLTLLSYAGIWPEHVEVVRRDESLTTEALFSKNRFNIGLIHDDADDLSHHAYINAPVQHIAMYQADSDKEKNVLLNLNGSEYPSTFVKVLYELLIKKDLIQKRFLNIDWAAFAKDKIWTFIVPSLIPLEENSHRKCACFDRMTITPDGHFSFDRFSQKDDLDDVKQKISVFYDNLVHQGCLRHRIEMIYYTDSDNLKVVIRTESFPMPQIDALAQDFKKASFPKRLWTCLDDFKQQLVNPIEIKAIADTISALKQNGPKLAKKKTYRTIKSILLKELLTRLEDYLLEQDIMLNPASKSKRFETRYHLFSDMQGLHYHKLSEKAFYYYVGFDHDNDLQQKLSRSYLIRKVVAEKEVNPETYLSLLNTNMVRAHQKTILPFPAKYIREHLEMENGHMVSESGTVKIHHEKPSQIVKESPSKDTQLGMFDLL